MPIIHGIEVGRRRGLDALGVTASIGIVFNFLGMLILAGLAGAMTRYSGGPSFALVPNFDGIGGFFVFVAVASLIIGAVVIMILRRPTANLKIVGPLLTTSKGHPCPKAFDDQLYRDLAKVQVSGAVLPPPPEVSARAPAPTAKTTSTAQRASLRRITSLLKPSVAGSDGSTGAVGSRRRVRCNCEPVLDLADP